MFVPSDDDHKIEPLHRHRSRIQMTPKPHVQTYPDKRSVAWEEHVAAVSKEQALATAALLPDDVEFTLPFKDKRVIIDLRFNLPKPVSYPKRVVYPLKKPDIDNYAKGVVDGLVKARLIEDDGLVSDLSIRKRYVELGHPQGVEIELVSLAAETV